MKQNDGQKQDTVNREIKRKHSSILTKTEQNMLVCREYYWTWTVKAIQAVAKKFNCAFTVKKDA